MGEVGSGHGAGGPVGGDDGEVGGGPGVHPPGQVDGVEAGPGEKGGGGGGAAADPADHHDGAVGGELVGGVGQASQGEVEGGGGPAGLPLLGLTDVEEEGTGPDPDVSLLGADLDDLGGAFHGRELYPEPVVAPLSAGLLLYRWSSAGEVEVLLVHPGGPLWSRREAGAWSIPKGEVAEGEDPGEAAGREFAEELGHRPPEGARLDLGEIRQKSGKRVRAWALSGDLDPATLVSNSFEMEWPPRSGRRESFPEVDRAGWFAGAEARRLVVPAQAELLDRLEAALAGGGP